MVNFSNIAASMALASLLSTVVAHPGEVHDAANIKRDINMRDRFAAHSKRTLGKCENSASASALKARAISRRSATAKALRMDRGLPTDGKKI